MRRSFKAALVAATVLLVAGLDTVDAQYKYRYGSYGASSGTESGVYVRLEAAATNPRNTDAVVATTETIADFGGGFNVQTPVIPGWDDDIAGRIAVGYAWAGGNRIEASYWGYDTDTVTGGNGPAGGFTHFAIGPPILTGGDYVGDSGSPGSYNIATEISASTADAAWIRAHAFTEHFTMEWSLGLRYATYEETSSGFYDEAAIGGPGFGQNQFDAAKSNEGEMIGARAAVRGQFSLTERVRLYGGLGFSFLDGELKAGSSLSPSGSANSTTQPTAVRTLTDDSRSGAIRDFEVGVTWLFSGDRLQLSFGWEQSDWEDIAADLMRNFPGTAAPLADRNSVVFSGYKLGVQFRF